MRHVVWSALIAISIVLPTASPAREASVDECAAVLRPNIEQINSDERMALSYFYDNAEYEFDRFKQLQSSGGGGGASFGPFSADFSTSSSGEELKEKIRQRMNRSGYDTSSSAIKGSARTYVTDAQVEAWQKCRAGISDSGSVILTYSTPDTVSFNVKISWRPAKGVGSRIAYFEIDGAKTAKDSSNIFSIPLVGISNQSFLVKPEEGAKVVKINVNVGADTDDIAIDLSPPRPPPQPNKRKILGLCQSVDICSGFITMTPDFMGASITMDRGFALEKAEEGVTQEQLYFLDDVSDEFYGLITTSTGFRGKHLSPYGFTLQNPDRTSWKLYVLTRCNDPNFNGVVTHVTDLGEEIRTGGLYIRYQGCKTRSIGYTAGDK